MGVWKDTSEHEPLLGSSSEKCSPREKSRAAWAWRSIAAFLAAGMAILVGLWALNSEYSLSNQFQAISEEIYDFTFGGFYQGPLKCSGHGTVVRSGHCLCDLGYAGSSCEESLPTASVQQEPKPNTVCFFVEELGVLGGSTDGRSQSTSELIRELNVNGYTVTVVYVGESSSLFTSVAAKFAAQGITVNGLPPSGVNFGEQKLEELSYNAYQYLLKSEEAFSHVYFSASSGVGYFTLLAQSQGLVAWKTHFIVGMDTFPKGYLERLDSGDEDYRPVDLKALKLDFMQQKSVELADTAVFTSSVLQRFAVSNEWNVTKSNQRIIPSFAPPKVSTLPPVDEHVRPIEELVFVGPMTIGGGLKVFCDAIDILLADRESQALKVTFLGSPSTVYGFSSEEYIELRSGSWESGDISWTIRPTREPENIIKYLTDRSAGRLAVLPSTNDGSGAMLQMILAANVPLIGSTKSALRDLVTSSDATLVATQPEEVSLAVRLRELIQEGTATVVSPKFTEVSLAAQWVQLLQSAKPKKHIDPLSQEEPLVSLVIVHHNRIKLLKQTIESIESQTYKNFEVIIVDDGSTDPAALSFLENLSWNWWTTKGWKVMLEPNRYLGAARNTGAKAARGQYILFIDDDDYSKPHQIETMLRAALKTKADVVTAGHDTFSGLARPSAAYSSKRYIPLGDASAAGMLENVFGDATMMVRRKMFIDFGGFTEDKGVGFEDYEFLAKVSLSEKHTLQAVPESLHWYRKHASSMSARTSLKENQLRMLRPYAHAEKSFSQQHKVVFDHTRKVFFEKHGISFDEALVRRGYQANSTTTATATPTIACPAYVDASGKSAIQVGLTQIWADKSKAFCWDFGRQSAGSLSGNVLKTLPVLLPVYSDYTQAGLPIVSALPCTPDKYSDAWAVTKIIVPDTIPFNFYKDYEQLKKAQSYAMISAGVYNRPIVPPKSNFVNNYNIKAPYPGLAQAWFQNNTIQYMDVGSIAGASAAGVPLNNEVIISKGGKPFGAPVTDVQPSLANGFYSLSSLDVSNVNYYMENTYQSVNDLPYSSPTTSVSSVQNCPIGFVDTAYKPSTLKLSGVEPSIVPKSKVQVKLLGSNFDSNVLVHLEDQLLSSDQVTFFSSSILVVTLDLSNFPGTSGTAHLTVNSSSPLLIRYYSNNAQVFSVTAGTLLANTDGQKISISGADLVEFGEGVCIFNTTEFGVSTAMTIESAYSASCTLPNIKKSGYYSIGFSMTVPKSSNNLYSAAIFLPVPNSRTNPPTIPLSVYTKGPQVVAAKFSDTGSGIYIDLDKPATVVNAQTVQSFGVISELDTSGPLPCSAIFQSQPVSEAWSKLYRTDSPDDCTFQQLSATRIKINLQSQFTAYDLAAIIPQGTIEVKPNSLSAVDEDLTVMIASRLTVDGPDNVPSPSVTAEGPAYLPLCADLELDLSSSYGSAGRLFSLSGSSVSFTSSSNVDPSSSQYQALQNALNDGLSAFIKGAPMLTVPATAFWLPADPNAQFETYNLTVTLQNFLGASSSDTIVINRVRDNSVPLVVVKGVNKKSVRVGKFQTLLASGSQACGVTSQIKYRWSVGGDGCTGVNITEASTAQLVIPPFSLKPKDTCHLVLQYKYADQSDWFTAPYKFNTAMNNLVISPGSSRTVSLQQRLVIDAIAFDDSYSTLDDHVFQCTWTCSHGGLPCVPLLAERLSSCFDNDLTGFADVGVYTLGVTLTNLMTGVSSTSQYPANITVINEALPSVKILLHDGQPSAFSSQFALVASVDSSTTKSAFKDLTFSWSSCDGPSYTKIDFGNPTLFLVDLSQPNVRTLKFAAGALLADALYCVMVSVTDPQLKFSGRASVTFKTLDQPSGGFCQIQTQSVDASTPLQYSCPLWVTDSASTPLSYSFLVRQSSTDPWTQVGSTTLSPHFSMLDFGSGQYQIKAVINDASGSSVSGISTQFSVVNIDTPPPAIVQRRDGCSTQLCSYVSQTLKDYESTKNIYTASKAAAVAALQIKPQSPEFNITMQLIETLLDDMLLDTSSNGPFIASLLQTAVGTGYKITADDIPVLATILQTAIAGVKTAGKQEYPSTCMSIASSTAFYEIIEQVLGSFVGTNSSAIDLAQVAGSIDGALAALGSCLVRVKAPQEYPFVFTSGFLSRTVGLGLSTENQYCSVDLSSGGLATTKDYVAFDCGSKGTTGLPTGTLVSVNEIAVDATFYDQDTELPLVATGADVNITLTDAFLPGIDLSSFEYAANGLLVSPLLPNKTLGCTVFDAATASWSTDQCRLTALSPPSRATCRCPVLPAGKELSVGVQKSLITAPAPGTTQNGGNATTTGTPGNGG
ncbi:hypothetical protein DFJ73DRAFT_793039, partial [Zopfochytrium polystomum]